MLKKIETAREALSFTLEYLKDCTENPGISSYNTFSDEVVDKPISMYSKPVELMLTQLSYCAFAYFEAYILIESV